MTGGDERFYAWLDGELSGADAAEMADRVASDPSLAKLAEEDRALKAQLRGAFGQVLDAPVPQRLRDALRGGETEVIDFGVRSRGTGPLRSAAATWMALAASLAVGILLGSTVLNQGPSGPLVAVDGAIYAEAGLADSLDNQLSSAPSQHPVRIGITYRNRRGVICRTFSAVAFNGLACRDSERWKLEAVIAASDKVEGQYRMAAGSEPALAEMITQTISGSPFDAEAERQAKSNNWR